MTFVTWGGPKALCSLVSLFLCMHGAIGASTTTCGAIRSSYKSQACCGSPGKTFTYDDVLTTCGEVRASYKRQGCCGSPERKFDVPGRNHSSAQPHIVFFLIDDLGFNDFVDSENLHVSWPNMKNILGESIYINTTYTEPFCTPSRAAFMSGRYKHLVGGSAGGHQDFSPTEETTLAQRLGQVGYITYGIGKWDLGWERWEVSPVGRGFHRHIGSAGNNEDHFTHCENGYYGMNYMESLPFESNDSSVATPYFRVDGGAAGVYSSTVYDDYANKFMHEHKNRFPNNPFFLYYAAYVVHAPYQVPAENYHPPCAGVEENEFRSALCEMQASVDNSIHKLTQTLKTVFHSDQYVLIVTGDNGGQIGLGPGGKDTGWGNNWPLRGKKWGSYEGGVRCHAAVWGSHTGLARSPMLGKTYTGGFMHLVDWHATIAELAGAKHIQDMSGFSMWQAITLNTVSPRTELYIASGRGRFYRNGAWKLLWFTMGATGDGFINGYKWPVPGVDENDMTEYENRLNYTAAGNATYMLFNIEEDPYEDNPVSNPTLLAEMKAAEAKFKPMGRRSIPICTSWQCCKNQTCAAIKKDATSSVTRAQAAPLHGIDVPCNEQVFYPFWDTAPCTC